MAPSLTRKASPAQAGNSSANTSSGVRPPVGEHTATVAKPIEDEAVNVVDKRGEGGEPVLYYRDKLEYYALRRWHAKPMVGSCTSLSVVSFESIDDVSP